MGYQYSEGVLVLLAVASYSTLGNFAAFFEVATACRLDGSRNRIRLLPFLSLGFLVNLLAIARATLSRKSWLAAPDAEHQVGKDGAVSRRQRSGGSMNLFAFALLLAFRLWLVLPLVPALREFFRPTDVEPLTMVGRDNADIARFARNFREYLQGQLNAFASGPDARGEETGKLPDNTPFMRLARMPNEISRTSMPPGAAGRLLILDQSTVLDGGEQFRLEIWSREDFIGGPSATYRAILGEQNVELAESSTIVRWVHSVGPLVVGPRSTLYGRAPSSEKEVHLASKVGFDRIGAPRMIVGTGSPRPMPPQSTDKKFQVPERSAPSAITSGWNRISRFPPEPSSRGTSWWPVGAGSGRVSGSTGVSRCTAS